MRILMIEDEPKTLDGIAACLRSHGYKVDLATSGLEGRRLAARAEYSLILLKVIHPDVDGLELLRLVAPNDETPVLMVGSATGLMGQEFGLRCNARDGILQPSSPDDVVARVRAVAPGSVSSFRSMRLKLADLELDLACGRVWRSKEPIELSSREIALLALLMRRRGQVTSAWLMAEAVWNVDFYFDRTVVDVAVNRLRTKIDLHHSPKLLHDVVGCGYVFEDRSS